MSIFSATGLGSCIIVIIAFVGVPLAWRHDSKKPGAVTPGQETNG